MEVKRYAASIQYGKGLHHFIRTDCATEVEAQQLAFAAIKRAKRGKGPLATAHIWQHVTKFDEVPASKTASNSGIIL